MNVIKKILLITPLFIMLPLAVSADCESDFKKIENDFKVSYKYNKDTDDFTITLVNPESGKYSWAFNSPDEAKEFTSSNNGREVTYTISNYKKTEYNYAVIATYSECQNKVFKSGTLELKKYNPYYDREECNGNEDFVLCQKDYDKAIDEETFKSRLETYLKSKEDNTTDNDNSNNQNKKKSNNENKQNIIDKIIDYIEENTIQVIIIIAFVITLIISAIIFTKRAIKSRRLE